MSSLVIKIALTLSTLVLASNALDPYTLCTSIKSGHSPLAITSPLLSNHLLLLDGTLRGFKVPLTDRTHFRPYTGHQSYLKLARLSVFQVASTDLLKTTPLHPTGRGAFHYYDDDKLHSGMIGYLSNDSSTFTTIKITSRDRSTVQYPISPTATPPSVAFISNYDSQAPKRFFIYSGRRLVAWTFSKDDATGHLAFIEDTTGSLAFPISSDEATTHIDTIDVGFLLLEGENRVLYGFNNNATLVFVYRHRVDFGAHGTLETARFKYEEFFQCGHPQPTFSTSSDLGLSLGVFQNASSSSATTKEPQSTPIILIIVVISLLTIAGAIGGLWIIFRFVGRRPGGGGGLSSFFGGSSTSSMASSYATSSAASGGGSSWTTSTVGYAHTWTSSSNTRKNTPGKAEILKVLKADMKTKGTPVTLTAKRVSGTLSAVTPPSPPASSKMRSPFPGNGKHKVVIVAPASPKLPTTSKVTVNKLVSRPLEVRSKVGNKSPAMASSIKTTAIVHSKKKAAAFPKIKK